MGEDASGLEVDVTRGRRRRELGLALAIPLFATGCGLLHPGQLNFTVDNRLHFTAPQARALLTDPVHLSWRMTGFTVARPGSGPATKDRGYFAVFLDRAPIKPGQTLAAIGAHDSTCTTDRARCLTRSYLNTQRVFTTTRTSLTIDGVPVLSDHEKVQNHYATVILLDTAGHRIGESTWEIDFRMRKNQL